MTAKEWAVHRRRQLAISWWSAILGGEEVTNLDGSQQAEGRAREEAGLAFTYCGGDEENMAGGSGDNHMRVPVQCPHGGFVHVSCMLEPADRFARGSIDPRSRVACSCEWAGGT